jgi:hypothetical protein
MEFKRENPAARFTVPDRPTVRQQLEYYSMASGTTQASALLRLWEGAQALIQEWECEAMPLYKADLDEVTDPAMTDLIVWASLAVQRHMNSLDNLPKNS